MESTAAFVGENTSGSAALEAQHDLECVAVTLAAVDDGGALSASIPKLFKMDDASHLHSVSVH